MSVFNAAKPSPSYSTACFSVRAATDPSVMPKVLEVFAKRGLVPTTWYSRVEGRNGEELHIDVQLAGTAAETAEHLACSLRQLVLVEHVLTSEKRTALTA